jgi:DNA-binding CsgD family transcriptional regulator
MQIGDLTFCAYLYLNFSSKDIAQYTFVTPRAVQIRKNRLRKKLNINSEEDIYLWIKNII